MTLPSTGFIQNVNDVANKLAVIESSNSIFDEGVVTVLQEIALLDLDEAILDLKKGNYLGNRKLDINLALNMVGMTEDLFLADPAAAQAIWVDTAKTVQYNSATITFTDGVVIELPFIFDGSPTTVSTHADLLAQLSRYDLVNAVRQVSTIENIVAVNATAYTITINGTVVTYVSDASATVAEITVGLANAINQSAIPVSASGTTTKVILSSDIVGNSFSASVNGNMTVSATVPNETAVITETAFLNKLTHTTLASFASDVVGEIIRTYDVTGQTSNLERIRLHAVSGTYIDANPVYFWAKTTSAFQTLSMRAGDIIKLGNDIDAIIALASRITEMSDLQNKMPQLVTNGDSLYTNIAKLVAIYEQLASIIAIHEDIKVGGTNYIKTTALDLALVDSKIATVAADLQLGNLSKIKIVKDAIAHVTAVSTSITNVNTVSTSIASVNTAATNIVAIQGASANASTATAQATIASTQAGISTTQASISTAQAVLATNKANSILGLTTQAATGAAGSLATVSYNSVDGKMTFTIPQGVQGLRGEAFTVNAVGLVADRGLYDSQIRGFSFLAIDATLVYFKLSNATGDWSVGAPFGKGDKGDIGLTGNGITGINFLSTTDAGGVAGTAGATDTYRITTSNSTAYNFLVYNGLNGVLVNDTTLSLIATWSNQKISDELALKASLNNPTFTGTVGGITAVMVGAPTGSGSSSGTNTGDQDLSGKQDVLPAGTDGQVLTLVAGAKAWTNPATGILTVVPVNNTSYTATAGKHYLLLNVAATTVTMPLTPAEGDTVAVTVCNSLTTNVINFNGQNHENVTWATNPTMTIDSVCTVTQRFLNSTWRLI